MEPHSTVEIPSKEKSSYFHNILSGIIALLTLLYPLYIIAHYSSSTVIDNTAVLPSNDPSPGLVFSASKGAH